MGESLIFIMTSLSIRKSFLSLIRRYFLVNKAAIRNSLITALFILFGAGFIFPIVSKLPLLGWDWYYFFYANNPAFNINTNLSAYPPFIKYVLLLFTWMDWRTSLSILNAITIMTVSIATWKNGGRYFDILLALTTPALWFLMWLGHPDGLVLFGLITGIIPLILMKPILSIFGILSDRKLIAWSILFLLLSLVIWPGWIFSLGRASFEHEADFGWAVMGWPLLIIGFVLIAGAGKDPYKLMAAGCFITPFLMPYHLVLITPAFGRARGWRKILLWVSSWFVFLGTGFNGPARIITFIFPLAAYCLCGSFSEYLANVRGNLDRVRSLKSQLSFAVKLLSE